VVKDYVHVTGLKSLEFGSIVPAFAMPLARKVLQARPKVKKAECIGCGKCREICPAGAIHMEKKKPVIDPGVCIRCFCCQEFCPKGALKVHRSFIARMLSKD
jgi:formate hydrogenlyase subunit 6/NADH:ubiquinone oxidoreductase subunit I